MLLSQWSRQGVKLDYMALLSWPFGSAGQATFGSLLWNGDIWQKGLYHRGTQTITCICLAPELWYVFSILSLWSKYKGKLVSQLPPSCFSTAGLLHTYIRSCSKIICFLPEFYMPLLSNYFSWNLARKKVIGWRKFCSHQS